MKALTILLSLLLISEAHGAKRSLSGPCEPLLVTKTGVQITGNFDPMEALKQAGLNPDKVSVKVVNKSKGDGYDDTPSMDLTFYYEDTKKIGSLDLYSKGDDTWGTYSGLEKAFKGKGIGALMYLIGSEILFRSYRDATILESFDASVSANRMWEKLVRHGHATKTPLDETDPEIGFHYRLTREHIGSKLRVFVSEMKGEGIPRRPSLRQAKTD